HLEGKHTIEAKGLVVAPGFIDLHEHGQEPRNYEFQAHDGVTTSLELEAGTADVDQWYARREGSSLINFGVSIGHIPVRMKVMNDPGTFLPVGDAAHREATAGQLQQIDDEIEKGLRRGALAVGMGINYTAAATHDEIVDVFRLAARHGASVHVHLRHAGLQEPTTGLAGIEEVIAAEEATRAAVADPLVMIASDGMPLTGAKIHPRGQATFSRVLGHYVREEKALDLMTALKKMTLMPAQRLEKRAPIFKDKGRIRVGADADITVFDANRVIDKATYEEPLQYSEGIQIVFVNGVAVVKDGHLVDGFFSG